MDKIQVMLISPVPPPAGGDSTWAYKYLNYCRNHGRDIYHVNTSMIGKRARSMSDSVILLDEIRRSIGIWTGIIGGIKRFKPQIAHVNTNCSPRGIIRDFVSIKIIKLFGVPYVIHCRCNVKDQLGKSRRAIFLFGIISKSAASVLVQNDDSKKYVDDIANIDSLFMPNFIEKEYIVGKKEILEKIKRVVYIGHVRKSKGIDEFIEVAKKNEDIEFVIAGPVTEDYTEEKIRYEASNIELMGAIDAERVKQLLDESDLLLFPTHTEGFSNSLLEAMARGIPVITTDVGANKKMLEKKGGIIVQVGDVEGMLNALTTMRSRYIREQMSAYNIQKVRKEYSMDSVIERIWALYEKIVKGESWNIVRDKRR